MSMPSRLGLQRVGFRLPAQLRTDAIDRFGRPRNRRCPAKITSFWSPSAAFREARDNLRRSALGSF